MRIIIEIDDQVKTTVSPQQAPGDTTQGAITPGPGEGHSAGAAVPMVSAAAMADENSKAMALITEDSAVSSGADGGAIFAGAAPELKN